MRLRNYPTKRKLLKDIENLRAENRHLSIELRNARTDLALEKTASSGYRHENRELKRKLKALETPESEAFNFECMGVSNVNEKEKSAEALQSLNGQRKIP